MKIKTLFLLLFLCSSTAIGCSWWPMGEEFRFYIFQPHLSGNKDAHALYYSAHFLNEYKAKNTEGPDENISAWIRSSQYVIHARHVDELLYKSSKEDIYDLIKSEKRAVEKFESNTLLRAYSNEGLRASLLKYVLFAKEVESVLNQGDPWEDISIDRERVSNYHMNAVQAFQKEINPELRLRYFYQIMVLSRYSDPKLKWVGTEIFEQYEEEMDRTHPLYWWSNFHNTAIKRDLGEINNERELIEFARVFRNCDDKKKYIYLFLKNHKWNKTDLLKACETVEERANIEALYAFKNPGKALSDIKSVIRLEPNHPLLEFLLIREINKIEDWYMTSRATGLGTAVLTNCWQCNDFDFLRSGRFHRDRRYLYQLSSVIKDLNVRSSKASYTLMEAYAEHLNGEYGKSQRLLDKIQSDNRSLIAQQKILQIVNDIKLSKEFVETDALTEQLSWLEKNKDHVYRFDYLKDQIMQALSMHYEIRQDFAMAALFKAQVEVPMYHKYLSYGKERAYFYYLDKYASPYDVKRIIDLIQEPNQSSTMRYLTDSLHHEVPELYDLWGTKYLRLDSLEQALNAYELVADSLWEQFPFVHYLNADPFYSEFYEKHSARPEDKTYTKPEFVKELLRLKSMAKHDPKRASYANFLLGNAYFNMTSYGNSWMYQEYGWSRGYSYSPENYTTESYFDCSRAMKYYQRAEQVAPNEGFAMLNVRMQAKCALYEAEHNRDEHVRKTGDYMTEADYSVYKKLLTRIKSRDERYYQDLVSICDRLEEYMELGLKG